MNMFSKACTICRLLTSYVLVLVLIITFPAADAAASFEQAKASSSQGPEFEAAQALQPGPSYWCSAGHHTDDEQVTWSATLEAPTVLRGLRVAWAYSPEMVQISISTDGRNWVVASPFKRTPSNDVAFNEDIFFDHPHTVKGVMISMRKALHDYFGISEVKPIETGEPQLMIVAGITSKESEMCLQVEGGAFNKEGAHVVLDACSRAIAAGDGREIWVQNINRQISSLRSDPKKCIVLRDGKTEGGGAVVLSSCATALEEGDGRSSWSAEPNSQLRLQASGFFCMTQKEVHGSEPGTGDIAAALGASASCESTAGDEHKPALALDRDVNTFWASGAFPDAEEHIVAFDLDLGKAARLAAVRLDWEYPPMAYKVQLSADGKTYTDVAENAANPSNVTLDMLPGAAEAQHVRILMTHPHATNGKIDEEFVYGIREIFALASRMDTAVGDCKEAANSQDARDKYFLLPVHEFEVEMAEKINSIEEDVLLRSRTLGNKTKQLIDSRPLAETCVSEKEEFKKRAEALEEETTALHASLLSDSLTPRGGSNPVQLGYLPGDSPAYPAEDCFAAKIANSPEAPSGFYWILPRCAPHPLRVFCDMQSSTSMYFIKNSRGIALSSSKEGAEKEILKANKLHSVGSLRLRCAENGLEPLVLNSAEQLHALKVAIKQIGFVDEENGVLPLAQDMGCLEGRCSGSFKDLYSGTTDLTALLIDANAPPNPSPTNAPTAGLRLPGGDPAYFNIETAAVAAAVCSTNAIEGQTALPHIDIGCEATAAHHPAFFGITNTNVVVQCPMGCAEAASLPVFGGSHGSGVYADLSSICRAAVHAGILRDGGVVSVSLENPLPAYYGCSSHGVASLSLNTPNTIELRNELQQPPAAAATAAADAEAAAALQALPSKRRGRVTRSIRIVPVAKDCPIESLSSIATAFIELDAAAASAAAETPHEKKEDVLISPMMANIINDVLQTMDEVHGLDATSVFAAQSGGASAASSLSSSIKPADLLQRSLFKMTSSLLLHVEGAAAALLNSSGAVGEQLEVLLQQLQQAEQQRVQQAGFESFVLEYTNTSFPEVFDVIDNIRTSRGSHSHSSWGFAEINAGGAEHKPAVAQTAAIKGNGPTEGSFAQLKRKNFFDGVLHINFLPFDAGSIGIAFRMRDVENMFLLSATAKRKREKEEVLLQLFRVEEGRPFLLMQKQNNNAFKEAKSTQWRVEMHHARIKVAIKNLTTHIWEPVIDAFDERFLSGSVALFVSGVSRGVFFDGLRFDAAKCSPIAAAAHTPRFSSSSSNSNSSSNSRRRRMLLEVSRESSKRRDPLGERSVNFHAHLPTKEPPLPWNICTEAVHPLHREDACQLLAANEAAAAAAAGATAGAATRAAAVAAAEAACAANFCGLCCKHNTALLGYYQTQMCLQQCKKNEVLAAALSIHLSRLLQECTHLKGEGFNHCNETDAACMQQACAFCCESSSNEDEITRAVFRRHFANNKFSSRNKCKKKCKEINAPHKKTQPVLT